MKYLAFILCLLFSVNGIGQKPNVIKDSAQKVVVKEIVPDNSKEIDAYKLLYETAQKSNDSLRETVQWTIGIVVGFILLILGSQFLYNWRLNKQEVETIKSEMETKFQELTNNLQKEREQIFGDLKDDIAKSTKENKDYLREKYLGYRELNESQIELHKKEVDRELTKIKADIEEHSGDIWLLRGVEANALSSFIRTALYKFEINHELKYIFDDIIPLLSKAEEIHQTDYNNLDKLIKLVKEKHGAKYNDQLNSLEKNYKGKPVYVYEDNRYGGGLLGGLMPGFMSKRIVKK